MVHNLACISRTQTHTHVHRVHMSALMHVHKSKCTLRAAPGPSAQALQLSHTLARARMFTPGVCVLMCVRFGEHAGQAMDACTKQLVAPSAPPSLSMCCTHKHMHKNMHACTHACARTHNVHALKGHGSHSPKATHLQSMVASRARKSSGRSPACATRGAAASRPTGAAALAAGVAVSEVAGAPLAKLPDAAQAASGMPAAAPVGSAAAGAASGGVAAAAAAAVGAFGGVLAVSPEGGTPSTWGPGQGQQQCVRVAESECVSFNPTWVR